MVTKCLVGLVLAISEEHGGDTVDNDELDGGRREGFLNGFGGLRSEGVVCAPIVTHMGEKKGADLIEILRIEQSGEIEPLLIIEHGELSNADVRKILRSKS